MTLPETLWYQPCIRGTLAGMPVWMKVGGRAAGWSGEMRLGVPGQSHGFSRARRGSRREVVAKKRRAGYGVVLFVLAVSCWATPAVAQKDVFPRPAALEPNVAFWRNIFSQY